MEAVNWDKKAKGLLKTELAKRDVSYENLSQKLVEIGVNETESSIRNKMSRGTFKASFLLQCLQAIGYEVLRIELGVQGASGAKPAALPPTPLPLGSGAEGK